LIRLGCVKRRAAAINAVRVSGRVQVAVADPFLASMENDLARRIRQFLDARVK